MLTTKLSDLSWLGLTKEEIEEVGPGPLADGIFTTDDIRPINLLQHLCKPDYFPLICKYIFNVELLPIQHVILKEMWTHSFPMLVGSRGMGKCVTGDSKIVTNDGIKNIQELSSESYLMKEFKTDLNIFGEMGYKKCDYVWKNLPEDLIEIETSQGFKICGTKNHPVRVVREGDLKWVYLSNIKIDDYIPIVRDDIWFENVNDIAQDTAYLFGCLIGDGGYTVRGQITLTGMDTSLIEECNQAAIRLWGKGFRHQNRQITYLLCGVNIWDELFHKYGFNSPVCAEKDFPKCILSAPKASMAAFISGLMDTDGTVDKNGDIQYCSKSKNLVTTLQFVLLQFGIISKVKKRLNNKYNRYYYYLFIIGNDARIFGNKIGFRLKRKQQRLLTKSQINSNTNKDILPHSLVLDKLLKLRQVYYKYNSFPGHGYNYNRQLINISRLKKYQMSYLTLDKVLELLKPVKNLDEYKFLKNIQEKHYFYDKVTKVKKRFDDTYDVFIPDQHSFVSNGLISHNSWLLGLYCLMRMVLLHPRRIVIAGAAFRQSKIIFEYMETIWNNAPILRDIAKGSKGPRRDIDRVQFSIGESYAVGIPIGTGEKIRGLRAQDVVADEFSAIGEEVFETVIAGFGAVTSSPISNVKLNAKRQYLIDTGVWKDDDEKSFQDRIGNQIVISGTAYYRFNHFYKYWDRYCKIIRSKGYIEKLAEALGEEPKVGFDHRDFSVIRIPHNLMPAGFMDMKMINRAKATMDKTRFDMEYSAIFPLDSNGFYSRRLIEQCVANHINDINLPSGAVNFQAVLSGNQTRKYVYGIDPASEIDNFSIVVLELWPDHNRIVYCWTTTRKRHKEKISKGFTEEKDFYSYCCRKIRDLMRVFPTENIGIDEEGGGRAIEEGLHDGDKMQPKELPLWPVIDPNKEKSTDGEAGLHILHMINFSDAKWVSNANHGMKKDFEDKLLLFPSSSSARLGIALEEDLALNREFDTLEDCIMDIEELKDELASIVHTQTGIIGRDRWDVPEVKLAGNKKGRQRKDRYSSLLIANMVARTLSRALAPVTSNIHGGFARDIAVTSDDGGVNYYGPAWFTDFANKEL